MLVLTNNNINLNYIVDGSTFLLGELQNSCWVDQADDIAYYSKFQ